MSSNGKLLRLIHSNGLIVDSLVYGIDAPWPVEPNGYGSTLELLDLELDIPCRKTGVQAFPMEVREKLIQSIQQMLRIMILPQ